MNEIAIKTEKLTKTFGSHTAVDGLDLIVNQGEIFGYLGPNGSGKTTTIRLLMNFIHPSEGTLQVLGMDPKQDSIEIYRQTGYLSGELNLYQNLTGEEHLRFLASLRNGVDWKIVESLEKRLDAVLTKKIKTLSHGNKQKVGIIAAFMNLPALIVLDEPSAGLDPLIQYEFNNLILEAKARGATVFLSSHILPDVERICDRVGIIREGKLIVTEQIENLKQKAVRPLEVHFAKEPNKDAFIKMYGVKDVKLDGKILRCNVVGSLDSFIKTIARFEVVTFFTPEPNLEEVFMSYYQKKKTGSKNAS